MDAFDSAADFMWVAGDLEKIRLKGVYIMPLRYDGNRSPLYGKDIAFIAEAIRERSLMSEHSIPVYQDSRKYKFRHIPYRSDIASLYSSCQSLKNSSIINTEFQTPKKEINSSFNSTFADNFGRADITPVISNFKKANIQAMFDALKDTTKRALPNNAAEGSTGFEYVFDSLEVGSWIDEGGVEHHWQILDDYRPDYVFSVWIEDAYNSQYGVQPGGMIKTCGYVPTFKTTLPFVGSVDFAIPKFSVNSTLTHGDGTETQDIFTFYGGQIPASFDTATHTARVTADDMTIQARAREVLNFVSYPTPSIKSDYESTIQFRLNVNYSGCYFICNLRSHTRW